MIAQPLKTYRVVLGKIETRQSATSARSAVLAATKLLPQKDASGKRLPAWSLVDFNGSEGVLRTARRERSVRVTRVLPKTTIGAPVRPPKPAAPMTMPLVFGKLGGEVELHLRAASDHKRRTAKRDRIARTIAHLNGAAPPKPVDERAKLLAQIATLRRENARLRQA